MVNSRNFIVFKRYFAAEFSTIFTPMRGFPGTIRTSFLVSGQFVELISLTLPS